MSVPYSKVNEPVVVVAAGADVEIKVPSVGYLSRLIVKQVVGTLGGFTVDVYDKSDRSAAGDEPHKIIPQQTVAGAAATMSYFEPTGVGYANKDGLQSSAERKLYVHIDPGGSGDTKEFVLAFTVNHAG